MFTEQSEPHRGQQGSSRQGWSKVNVRAIIYDLRLEYPDASHDRLARILYERMQSDEDVGMSAADWLIALCQEAWRSNKERAEKKADPEVREAQRKETAEKIDLTVNSIREQFLMLNMEMPNGKRLRFCDGNYVAKFGGGLAKAGKKAGRKLMGQVFDEDSLRKYVKP